MCVCFFFFFFFFLFFFFVFFFLFFFFFCFCFFFLFVVVFWGFLIGIKIKALTALVGRLSLIIGWENDPERGLKTTSVNPQFPLI